MITLRTIILFVSLMSMSIALTLRLLVLNMPYPRNWTSTLQSCRHAQALHLWIYQQNLGSVLDFTSKLVSTSFHGKTLQIGIPWSLISYNLPWKCKARDFSG